MVKLLWKECGKVELWLNSKSGYFGRLKRTEAEKTNSRDCMGRPMLVGRGAN
jgi:hypothetical protein